jgi:hypothetical protein
MGKHREGNTISLESTTYKEFISVNKSGEITFNEKTTNWEYFEIEEEANTRRVALKSMSGIYLPIPKQKSTRKVPADNFLDFVKVEAHTVCIRDDNMFIKIDENKKFVLTKYLNDAEKFEISVIKKKQKKHLVNDLMVGKFYTIKSKKNGEYLKVLGESDLGSGKIDHGYTPEYLFYVTELPNKTLTLQTYNSKII